MAFGLQQLFLPDTAGSFIQFLLLKTQQVFLLGLLLKPSGKLSAFFTEPYPLPMGGSILRTQIQQTSEGIQNLKLCGVGQERLLVVLAMDINESTGELFQHMDRA